MKKPVENESNEIKDYDFSKNRNVNFASVPRSMTQYSYPLMNPTSARIFYYMTAIYRRQNNRELYITYSDILKVCGLEDNGKTREMITKTFNEMFKTFRLEWKNSESIIKKFAAINVFSSAKADSNDGIIYAAFTDEFCTLLNSETSQETPRLKKGIYQIPAETSIKTKKHSSTRLDEIIDQNRLSARQNTNKEYCWQTRIELFELRKKWKCEEKYPRISDFKDKVFLKTVKEINENEHYDYLISSVETTEKIKGKLYVMELNCVLKMTKIKDSIETVFSTLKQAGKILTADQYKKLYLKNKQITEKLKDQQNQNTLFPAYDLAEKILSLIEKA